MAESRTVRPGLQRSRTTVSTVDEQTGSNWNLKAFLQDPRDTDWFVRRELQRIRVRRGSHDCPIQHLESSSFKVDVERTRAALLNQEDTNNNLQITVDDKGPKVFHLGTLRSDGYHFHDIRGNYFLANLLQELTLAQDVTRGATVINGAQLTEDPVHRMCRRIQENFWSSLLRQMDSSLMDKAARDPKDWTADPRPRIYVPQTAPEQLAYYLRAAEESPELRLDVVSLPGGAFSAEFVKTLNNKPGILALQMRQEHSTLRGLNFVVPGGRFNELYGWDSYFCCLGLFDAGRTHIAKDIALNFCFEIDHYGIILNANRSYYLGRSQPPFLTDLARRTYARIRHEPTAKDFLRTTILSAIKEYHHVWMATPRFDARTGLSRYRPAGVGIPPEVEESQFDHVLLVLAAANGMSKFQFIEAYNDGTIKDTALDTFIMHDRAVRESGHDTSYRLENLAADLATIDLTSLLYKYETDIAWAIKEEFDDRLEIPATCLAPGAVDGQVHSSSNWLKRAEERKSLVTKHLWNQSKGIFCDYNTSDGQQTQFESVTCLWALWSGLADADQAALLVSKALPKFEHRGGLSCTSKESCGPEGPGQPQRQWDYPYGWAPHQIMAWDGLKRYGYHEEAERLAYKWLHMVTRAAVDFNGVIVEKYDVTEVRRPHKVDAEYGNQGASFGSVAQEGFGWTNASYTYGQSFIGEKLRRPLALGVPYESVRHLI